MSAERMLIAEIAESAGIEPATFRSYVARGFAPAPDGHFGRTPFWLRSTIESWRGGDDA